MLNVGDLAPAFSLPTGDGQVVQSRDLLGSPYVIYFYPKDDTPGCTREACDFRDQLGHFTAKGAKVFGVSKDSPERHAKFSGKYGLNFTLLSDATGETCEAFGVWQEKKLYGKTSMGIVRSTFVVDAQGKVRAVFPKVKVDGHVEKVLAAL